MSQIWRGVSGGIEVLENVNEMADLPDISTIDSEGVWYIESGEFGPDYIAPTNWDSSAGEFTDWFSLFDGRILADIPDSVVMQYYASTWSESDSVWIDDAAVSDINLEGSHTSATLSDGSDSINGDGTNDYGTATLPSEFQGGSLNEFSVEVVVEYTDDDVGNYLGLRNDDSDQTFRIVTNIDATTNLDEGNFAVLFGDDSDNRLYFDANVDSLNDGVRHNISIIINDAANNDADIIIDGESQNVNFVDTENPQNFTSWDRDCAFWARNDGGTIDEIFDGEIGAIRWHDEAIESQTIDEYGA